MKRFLLAFALAFSFVAPAFAQTSSNLAPADRYFGRLKMSILGVRNQIKDLSERADLHPEDAEHIYDKAVLVEDALHDWQRHFPRDPWIPKYTYGLAQLYGKLNLEDARVRRSDTLEWLASTYPASQFARLER